MTDKTILGNLETIKHINRVRELLWGMIAEVDKRARLHDLSKLESPEAEIFGEYTPELGKVKYGTPEYEALLDKVRPALDHHYSKNRHHPQFHQNGVNDMNLIDILEMLCDWRASSERTEGGNIRKSIEVNSEKYGIDAQLTQIFKNTVKEMFD